MASRRVHPVQRGVQVDEGHFRVWVQWGFKELAEYLAHYTAFAVYLEQKEKQ